MLSDKRAMVEMRANDRRRREALPEAFGAFMSTLAKWSWFINPITFRGDAPCSEKAVHQIGEWLADVQALAGGANVGWVLAEEFGRAGGRWHAHGMVSGVDALNRRFWWSEAFRRFGRTRIEPFDPERGAAFYAAKYAAKQLGRIHFGGMLSGVELSRMFHEGRFRRWEDTLPESAPVATKECVARSADMPRDYFRMTLRRN